MQSSEGMLVLCLGLTLPRAPFATCAHTPPPRSALHVMCEDGSPTEPIARFVEAVDGALQDGTFVKLVLSGNAGVKTASSGDPLHRLQRIEGRHVQLKKGPRLQLTFKYEHRDSCQNLPLPEAAKGLESWLRAGAFRNGRLMATDADTSLEGRKCGHVLLKLKPTAKGPPPELAHNRKKRTALEPSSAFLQALGVTHEDGRPRAGKADKLRQIQKFVETLSALVRRGLTEDGGGDEGGGGAAGQALRIVDAGCGRGYLTFAAHSHFASRGWAVETTGVELRADLVAEMNGISRELGGRFAGLGFECSAMADFFAARRADVPDAVGGACDGDDGNDGSRADGGGGVDILIALHACDTATDDALWCGISNGARVIVVAPCCHKEVRRQLELASGGGSELGGALSPSLRHGIYRERTAEMVTDTLRTLLLELAGYDVAAFEFIGGEHTAKNVMLTATRRPSSRARSARDLAEIREQLRALCAEFGVRTHSLAAWMGEDCVDCCGMGGCEGGAASGAAASSAASADTAAPLPAPAARARTSERLRPSRRSKMDA